MADAHDNLDEFFDFAQLEQDSAACGGCFQTYDAGSILSEHVTPMDWQPVVAEITTPPSQMLQDEYTQDVTTQHFGNQCPRQWSLVDMSNQSSTIAGPASVGPTWLTPHVPTTELQPHNELLTAPPSPFHAHEQFNLTNENIDGTLPIVISNDPSGSLDEPTADTSFVQASHAQVVSPKPARASLPTRHASSASWKPASAKRKGPQSRIPLESRQILEDEFATNPYPLPWEIDIIAHQANLEVKKVRNWFNNTRARKKGEGTFLTHSWSTYCLLTYIDSDVVSMGNICKNKNNLKSRLSHESLEALGQQADTAVEPPQPPLALYLAQSYQEEAVELSDVQAALDSGSLSGSGYSDRDTWSTSRRGSAVGSIVSSEGTAPTAYTVSSNGSRSNVSSFGRDRRRGRRRMTWKESPHTRSINGVNSAGQPQKDLPFFCTFCPRAFKTKYEWIRHEDSVHALRTTWICCDAKSESLQSCPFCGQTHPDDAHMATHKYQQCRSKPESQRTFYRRDHFVQHLHHVHFANAKHPSVRVGCQARLMATEGQHFGCKDLSMKWRRFGAPMKKDDPMLHCGFCGKKSKDWPERCEHVAEHLVARELNRSVWWPERRENHLENLYSTTPFESFRCRYCLKVFTDIQTMNEHSHCRVWSCRFLRSFDDVAAENAGPPLCQDFPSAKAHHCHLCGAGYRAVHIEHAHNYHRYRSCNQEFYESEDAFLQHLHNFHGASQPALLRGSAIIEQTFMRNKGASFEPVEFNESMQPCHMDLDNTSITPFATEKPTFSVSVSDRKPQKQIKKSPPMRKQTINTQPGQPSESSRARTNTVTTKTESHEPRFFRLSTYVPFVSSRVFYSRHSRSTELPRDHQAVLEEVPKPHLTSLVMSAGLVSMAVARWTIKPEKRSKDGMVELVLEEGVE
jgi:hypothetical protein